MNEYFLGVPVPVASAIIAGIFSGILGAYLNYHFSVKKLIYEIRANVNKEKNTKILDAFQQFWKLLAYTTDTENANSIMVWEQDKHTKQNTYWIRRAQANAYIDRLAEIFYGGGYGLYLNKEARAPFFEYRSILYGVLLPTRDSSEDKILVKNPEMANKLKKLHQDMVVLLREKAGLEDVELPDA